MKPRGNNYVEENNNMWFSALKLALNAGSHIYKKKQETKMMMANAQAKHAEKMARGIRILGQTFRGKAIGLERRVRFGRSNAANFSDRVGGLLGRSGCFCQDKRVLRPIPAAPVMVHKFMDPCRGEYLWYKGNTNI